MIANIIIGILPAGSYTTADGNFEDETVGRN